VRYDMRQRGDVNRSAASNLLHIDDACGRLSPRFISRPAVVGVETTVRHDVVLSLQADHLTLNVVTRHMT
jgi:hypothetical protein